ncbi:sulfate transporter CysZ [Marichromatium bheemlicum]|uniref:Sulfate transporter CysZ n=1 Tax=Marichromatium bheemlicum TaxID=365339 RepID=A0ABX1I4N0_9GAMM|nr:sulfate transporter CysZ [Marichromatium bheemlicum]NKN32510.1 sulfate transporter CysZ [Marichromatium bheemlicum]
MVAKPMLGAGYLLQGVRLITRPGLRRFVLIPLAVNILVFSLAIYLGVREFATFLELIEAQIPSWLGWLDWILWPVFALLLLVVVFYTFNLVANLIASPFNNLLAEKVELLLTGRPLQDSGGVGKLLKELLPTLFEELVKVVYALALAIPFLVLLFVPVVGPLLWFLYTAWILAVQYSDYPMGNHGLKFREMRARLRGERGLSLGFGAAAAGLGMVPVVNFILMPSAVAGATAMWVREFNRENTRARYQGPYESRMTTRWVRLEIDHLSGHIDGEVLLGPLRGQRLGSITTEALLELLAGGCASDADSAEALEVYLGRERGQRFSERPRARQETEPRSSAPQPPQSTRMSRDEACAILGVGADADNAAIRAAHRRLIQRMHPDRGGSAYLAAKINEAKTVLMRAAEAA